jgi:acetyl-CoA decarbonylase/synthase complex subunit gamma
MALTGIAIYKWLPKTNCGECGVPTCLAFAMGLAAGKSELSACPYVSNEAKEKLDEASAPPIRPITIGVGDNAVKVGGETVMFRHEKRFENRPGIGAILSDKASTVEAEAMLNKLKTLQYERVGQHLRAELLALKADSGDAATFTALVKKVSESSDAALILMSDNIEIQNAALEICAVKKPLIYAATKDNIDDFAELAMKHSCPLAVKAANLDELVELTEILTAAGVKDMVLDGGSREIDKVYQEQIIIRRAALQNKFRPLGFPTIVFPCEMTEDPLQEAVIAAALVAKYGGIIVLSDFRGESLFPLLVERLNIYTDPQRPLATTQGIYEINGPDTNSPVLLTCNFSLTYFIVSGETENSKVSSHLLIKDTEGLSVLTAWAAGKFSADDIALFVKKSGIADKVSHRKLIIPGYIAVESGGLEEELDGWEIEVGPREAAHIPSYLKNWKV